MDWSPGPGQSAISFAAERPKETVRRKVGGVAEGDPLVSARIRSSGIPILETERLRLRAFRPDDVDPYVSLTSDPEAVRYLIGGPGPWDAGRAWRHLAFLVGHWHLTGAGTWAVEERSTGTFLGTVGFSEPIGWPGFELAWSLARRHWGRGYATEAARAALHHAFEVWGKERVVSLIDPRNERSIRVAERLGESLEGPVRHFGMDLLCYGIDRETFRRTSNTQPAD
jgi:RimJ/RimL family protein N-acetyltransferase